MQNLKQKHLNKKLSHKYVEPFQIKDVMNKQTYHLVLSESYWQIHSVFHVSYLESYHKWLHDENILDLLSSELINDEEKHEIEEILDCQTQKCQL